MLFIISHMGIRFRPPFNEEKVFIQTKKYKVNSFEKCPIKRYHFFPRFFYNKRIFRKTYVVLLIRYIHRVIFCYLHNN